MSPAARLRKGLGYAFRVSFSSLAALPLQPTVTALLTQIRGTLGVVTGRRLPEKSFIMESRLELLAPIGRARLKSLIVLASDWPAGAPLALQLLAVPDIFRRAGGPVGGSERYCGLLGPHGALFRCPTDAWVRLAVWSESMVMVCAGRCCGCLAPRCRP